VLSKDIAKGLLAVLAGMIIFKGVTYLPLVEGFIRDHPFIAILIGFGIFFFRDQIVEKVTGKQK
jgi:hypothetical protein